ncbi:ATP-binding cassette domain-containing protein [Spiribacter sp. 2438]|uniref:ATP-binding cassette domain-containing protein n=1 Tax=Spiribacter sp. 2438 TaxID=2666185 RepID=UPI0012AF7E01|nr:ATP-binding cassette domain-containing protein [Spiribacter sp. 2438]QGM21220.1 ATP-binding cassette domain-containing protein [Spiribacter sp. 2438]
MADTWPLVLQGVTFAPRGQPLLGPIDLTLAGSGRTVIVGPNGAGKSLLLRLCHGLLAPSTGRVRAGTLGSPEQVVVRRRQALVFQRPIMLRRSVLANVRYPLQVQGLGRRQSRQRALAALERVGLVELAGRSARVLSGGEQQRLALARAWVLRPEVLFLDEPTSALDPATTQAVEAAIRQFDEHGTRIVMVTHNLGQARRLGDDCLFLAGGRLVERGPAASLLTHPSTPEAVRFLTAERGTEPVVANPS